MMVKSAMMTTAYNLKGDHAATTQGAGHVNPKKFLDPGLVFDSRGSRLAELPVRPGRDHR